MTKGPKPWEPSPAYIARMCELIRREKGEEPEPDERTVRQSLLDEIADMEDDE